MPIPGIVGLIAAAALGYGGGAMAAKKRKELANDEMLAKNMIPGVLSGDEGAIAFANSPEGQKFFTRMFPKEQLGAWQAVIGAMQQKNAPQQQARQDFLSQTNAPEQMETPEGMTSQPPSAEQRTARRERMGSQAPTTTASVLGPDVAKIGQVGREQARAERMEPLQMEAAQTNIAANLQQIEASKQAVEASKKQMEVADVNVQQTLAQIEGLRQQIEAFPEDKKLERQYKQSLIAASSAQAAASAAAAQHAKGVLALQQEGSVQDFILKANQAGFPPEQLGKFYTETKEIAQGKRTDLSQDLSSLGPVAQQKKAEALAIQAFGKLQDNLRGKDFVDLQVGAAAGTKGVLPTLISKIIDHNQDTKNIVALHGANAGWTPEEQQAFILRNLRAVVNKQVMPLDQALQMPEVQAVLGDPKKRNTVIQGVPPDLWLSLMPTAEGQKRDFVNRLLGKKAE